MVTLLVVASGVPVGAWFSRRARLGAHVRATAGVRLRTVDRLSVAFTRTSLTRAGVGFLAGVVFSGLAGGIFGAAGGLGSEAFQRARRTRAARGLLEQQLPEVLRAVASALRAGRNLPQALESARDEAAEPIRDALAQGIRRMTVGGSLDEALNEFERRAQSTSATLAVETLRIGRAAGTNLPAILDVAVESLAETDRIARDRRATTAQARMSGLMVGMMPIAFFAISGSGARRQFVALLGEPIGWILLGVGALLEGAGFWWMRSLVRIR